MRNNIMYFPHRGCTHAPYAPCMYTSLLNRPVASEGHRGEMPPQSYNFAPPPLKCGRPTTNKTKCRPIVLTSTPYSYTRSGGLYLSNWSDRIPSKCNASCDPHILPL